MVCAGVLKVMLIDANRERAALVEACLRDAGFAAACVVPAQPGLLREIEREAPDVVVIDLESPDRDLLESLSIVSLHNPTPIVMFTEEQDPDFIAAAVDAGVTAYVVDGLKPDKVKPIIDVAMAQFKAFQRLRSELLTTRLELSDRILIDRAKALLMERSGVSEDEAHAWLRAHAMNTNTKLVAVARSVIDAAAKHRGAAP